MSNFSTNINQPPIYQPVNDTGSNNLSSNWQKLFNQITNQQNVTDGYGNPSVALNSDFYWNNGVPTPVTQADPDDTLVSEKWQIHGKNIANYTITQVLVPATDLDQTGSLYYLHIVITSYSGTGNGDDFYIYQRQTGNQFLRRYQNRNISFSSRIINNTANSFKSQMQVYTNYDSYTATLAGNVSSIDTSTGFYASTVTTPSLSGKTVGGGCYTDFRLAFYGTGDINLFYLKPEMCDKPTDLYVDHALERARIDFS